MCQPQKNAFGQSWRIGSRLTAAEDILTDVISLSMDGSEKWIQVWFVTVWPAAKGRTFQVTDDINILFACSEDA